MIATDEPLLRLRQDKLDWLEAKSELIAIDTDRDVYLSGNPAAALLWQELAVGTTRSRLIEILVDTYDLEIADATRDVGGFLESLRAHGLMANDR